MDLSTLIDEIWTVVAMVLFIGIVIWAWSDKRKAQFDAAAQLPFDEGDASTRKEIDHG